MSFLKMKKTAIIVMLALPLTVLGAASSSSEVAVISVLAQPRSRSEMHDLAERAVTLSDNLVSLGEIVRRKKVAGSSAFDQQDHEGLRPFDSALRLFYQLSNEEREAKRMYFNALFDVLRPACITTEQERARSLSYDLLSQDEVKSNKARALFKDASPVEQRAIREQFKYISGYYLDAFLYETLQMLLSECIVKKFCSSGDEKSEAVGLLSYLVSSYWNGSKVLKTENNVNLLLGQTVLCETSLPSFAPALLRSGADPCKIMQITADKCGSAFYRALANLTEIPSKRGIASCHLLAMVCAGLPEDETELLKSALGDLNGRVASEAFPEHYRIWLKLCTAAGANLEALRFLVFPLLKHKIKNVADYMAVKEAQSKSRLSTFEQFTLACLVCEFIACIASSLDGYEVYNLNRYTQEGNLVRVNSAKDWHAINAERFRAKLKQEGNMLVRYMQQNLLYVDKTY